MERIFRFSIIFLILYFGLSLLFPAADKKEEEVVGTATIKSLDNDYAEGQLVKFQIKNPQEEPLDAEIVLEARKSGEWKTLPLEDSSLTLSPSEKRTTSFSAQNTDFFGETGRYRAVLKGPEDEFLSESEFEVSQAGVFRSLWRTVFFKPIYNTLIVLIEFCQRHLAYAVILLTLLVKFILLMPSKKGIVAQQKMQKIQPEIEKLKKKYKSDPQRQAKEMMGLWKKHGVSPGSALWPTLLQFPVLIALFFVIKDGLMPHNAHLLYSFPLLQNFDFTNINFHFFWLDLRYPDPYFVLPVTIGALQFFQMKSMTAKRKKTAQKNGKDSSGSNPQESVMAMMTYFLPVIIIVFSATLPSAVGLYWGVSTLFAIVQQYLLQKQTA